MSPKNIFPKIIKNSGKKKEVKESGCCFRSCGGKPCIQEHREISDNPIGNILKKIK